MVFSSVTSAIANEKLAVTLVEDSPYLVTCFPLAGFRVVSLPLTFDRLTMMCSAVSLWIYSTWNLLILGGVMFIMFFIKSRKILAIISSDVFPTPFSLSCLSGFPRCPCLHVWWCPPCLFFFFLSIPQTG